MDIDYFDDGKHQGSGLGSSDNGPVPAPAPTGQAAYDAATQGGTPIEPDSRIDGLADDGFNDQGASTTAEGQDISTPSADSVPQPEKGQTSPMTNTYPR
jgi:hypothetical protein